MRLKKRRTENNILDDQTGNVVNRMDTAVIVNKTKFLDVINMVFEFLFQTLTEHINWEVYGDSQTLKERRARCLGRRKLRRQLPRRVIQSNTDFDSLGSTTVYQTDVKKQ